MIVAKDILAAKTDDAGKPKKAPDEMRQSTDWARDAMWEALGLHLNPDDDTKPTDRQESQADSGTEGA